MLEVVPKAENFFIVYQAHTKKRKGFDALNIVSLLLVRRQLCLFNLSVSLHAGHAMSTNGPMWNLEYEKAEISRSRSYQLENKGFPPPPPRPSSPQVLVLVIRLDGSIFKNQEGITLL